jgi:chromosome segregation ATPase
MDDSSGNSKWVWILGVIALMVAVVGLVIAVAANSNAVDEDQVVNEATAQLKGELSGLGGAIKASKAAQRVTAREAARDRARIKRAVGAAVKGTKKRIGRLNSEVQELKTEASNSLKTEAELKTNIANLTTKNTELQTEFRSLKKRVRTLEEL